LFNEELVKSGDDNNVAETIEKTRLHGEKYKRKMQADSSVHRRKNNFSVGDIVLIRKDFDSNVKTRKNKFESFFLSEQGTIVDVCLNNTFKVKFKNPSGQIIERGLHSSQIKPSI
jgi:hypothetical protein